MDKVGSSPVQEAVSPLGISRYGRTRKPKISADFCHIDDALKNEDAPIVVSKSPVKTVKQTDTAQKKINKISPEKRKVKVEIEVELKDEVKVEDEISEDIKNEGLKVLNDVFESAPIDDVLKIISSSKPIDINIEPIKKRSPQQLRTYGNKRKPAPSQMRVIETFGLPDDPIVPMYEEKLVFKPFKDLDIDESVPENVTLVDDLIENILKENSGDCEIGDVNKNKENDRNIYKSTAQTKLPNKLQNNKLNNGLLLDKKCKSEPYKKNYREYLDNPDDSIEKIVESFTDTDGNLFLEDLCNTRKSPELISNCTNLQTDHTYTNTDDSNLLNKDNLIVQKTKDDLVKKYNNRSVKKKKTEKQNAQEERNKQNKTVEEQNVIEYKLTKTNDTSKNHIEEINLPNEINKNFIERNDIAMKIRENYDKINRDNLIGRHINGIKTAEDEVAKILLLNKHDKTNGIVDNNTESNLNETTLDGGKINEISEISKNDNEKSSVIEVTLIEDPLKKGELNPNEAASISIHTKEIFQSTDKSDLRTNENFEMKEISDQKKNTVKAKIIEINLKEDGSKLKNKKAKQSVGYKHLEEFENYSSEEDTIPLSARKKGGVSTVSVKRKSINKRNRVDVPTENNLQKSSETKLLNEEQDMNNTNTEENLNESTEEIAHVKTTTYDQEDKELSKSDDRKSKLPKIPKNIRITDTGLELFVGRLLWAKVGNFPYWPCMTINEPESNTFTKITYNRKICHVRFFGDKGRRAWVSEKQLLAYCSVEELEKNKNVSTRDVKPPTSSRYQASWITAIEEANSLESKSLEEKLEFFENVLKQQDKEKEEKKHKYYETSKKKKEQEKIVKEEKVGSVSPKRLTRSSSSHRLELLPKQKKPKQEDSESESESDVSLQGFPSNMEEQVALYKRNSLFKKVTKERVCQVCLKLGAVFKCKGRCQGFYHVECAEKHYGKITTNGVKNEVQLDNKDHLKIDKIDDLINNEVIMSTNEKQVEIISIKDRKRLTPIDLTLGDDIEFKSLPLLEQIDHKMNEVMHDINDKALYLESTTDSSLDSVEVSKSGKKNDEISALNDKKIIGELFCRNCLEDNDPSCCVCHKDTSKNGDGIRQRCSWLKCGKYYHAECLKHWPQTQWSVTSSKKHSSSNEFVCPMHVCHTCVSDDPRSSMSRCYSDKLARCVYCPSTYHTATYCVPAGTQILSYTQIICPKHENLRQSIKKRPPPINTTWCFICSEGGTLICCETCPTSVHAECLDIKYTEDDKFICEDCETGRFPLYDEIVWVKLGSYRWWPAIILFPNEIPEKVKKRNYNPGEFVVKFFGTYDHYWISKGRVFLFQEGDTGGAGGTNKRKMEEIFKRSVEEATTVHLLKKEFKESILREAEGKSKTRPPPYVKIKVNRPVGNVRQFDGNISNTTPCECDPKQKNPCGPESDCLNRLLLTECDPTVCPAGDKCQNQNFEQRNYPHLIPYKTEARGWGLQSLEPLTKGQFVIEYVGEMIDEQEYQRRIKQMHELKEENYYFLTIDKDRMIDAGPKGNLARFMNHSCHPNCETQKWTVNGDTRVGLFAMEDIPANTELTFNYNLECVGKEKKICRCGAPNCSGFIGLKVKQVTEMKSKTKPRKYKKKRSPTPIVQELSEPCFICGSEGDLRCCDNKICSNYYHVKCVGLENWPEGKWICPWHSCSVCMKRTIRCCVKCLNSYCPKHSQGNIRHDKMLGFICSLHDPRKNPSPAVVLIKTEETEVTSTTEEMQLPLVDPLDLNSEVGEVVTSTPYKANAFNSRQGKRKRSGGLLDTNPTNKRSKFDRDGLWTCSLRTLRSAMVNSSSDDTKLKHKA